MQSNVSPLVPFQLERFRQEEDPEFGLFLQAYYEWMEQVQNPMGLGRAFLDNLDVDRMADQFILFAKEEYLKGIRLETVADTRRLIKHSLDLYRSRGTPRAIVLFFRAVFGEEASVYYPGDDLLSASSARWVRERYLEVTPRPANAQLVGAEVQGYSSGATAFVDRVVRRRFRGKTVEVLYLSAVTGDFSTGEFIGRSSTTCTPRDPIIVGSLTTLLVRDGGRDFAVGDLVDLESPDGIGGQARVSGLSTTAGQVTWSLEDGGWGYTTNSVGVVSTPIPQLSGWTFDRSLNYLPELRVLTQPQANIRYTSNGTVALGAGLTGYNSTGGVLGTGQVLALSQSNGVGYLFASLLTGNLASNATLYTSANAQQVNVAALVDLTATGQIIGYSDSAVLSYSSLSGSITVGDPVYQVNTAGGVTATAVVGNVTPGNTVAGTVGVTSITGDLMSGCLLHGNSGAWTANLSTSVIDVGVRSVQGTFTAFGNNYVLDLDSGSHGTINSVGTGTGASFEPDPSTMTFTEAVNLNSDYVLSYANIALDATTFGAGLNSTNVSSNLNLLNYETLTLGTLTQLRDQLPGTGYSLPPPSIALDPLTALFDRVDYVVTVTNVTGSFSPGEPVSQTSSGAQGVLDHLIDPTDLYVKRVQWEDRWLTGLTGPSDKLVGSTSGATADVVSWYPDPTPFLNPVGMNAVIDSNTSSSNTTVASLEVTDSGVGLVQGEVVTFENASGGFGSAEVVLSHAGITRGYFASLDGMPSSQKTLYDGHYWQEHSYVVESPLTFDKYGDMLKRLLHVAGTIAFSAYSKVSTLGSVTEVTSSQRAQYPSSLQSSIDLDSIGAFET